MATIVTRSGKGSPLTHAEVDSNFTNLNTDKLELSGGTMTGNLSFGDNDKAIFGAGSDLQIYHDGSASYIDDQGEGPLKIKATDFRIKNAADTKNYLRADDGGAVSVYYDNAIKLATTSTGVDITGTLTSDGLTLNDGTTDVAINSSNVNSRLDLIASRTSSNLASFRFKDNQDRNKLNIDQSGDISFYEDTGTTAKFFWDASAESLGIGTSSPSRSLEVYGAVTPRISIVSGNTSTGSSALLFGDTDADNIGSINYAHVDNSMRFSINSAERMRIDSSGNVGIGVTNPSDFTSGGNNLVVGTGSGDQGISIYAGLSSDSSVFFVDSSSGTGAYRGQIRYRHDVDDMSFHTAGGFERMRIDSSGNLLVGQSSSTLPSNISGINGMAIRNDGVLSVAGNGTTVGRFNRNTSDGDILGFYKNGTTVGSILATSGDLGIGTGDTGLRFGDNNDAIFPITTATGFTRDNSVDLGYSSSRFKDLYLSGGVLDGTTTGYSFISGGSATNNGSNIFVYGGSHASNANTTIFRNGSSETMRIDSSGDLLLGKTTAASTTAGMHLDTNGKITTTRSSGPAAAFVRLTSDGSIVSFQKDSTTVGSIGALAGDMVLGTGDVGFRFDDGSDVITPWNISTNSARNSAIDLGHGTARFKDLYLSGGVYLGGTGASNRLDDYEEGDYQPSLSSTGGGSVSALSTFDTLSYTKVGRFVHIQGNLHNLTISGVSGDLDVTLPFVTGGGTERSDWAAGFVLITEANTTSDNFPSGSLILPYFLESNDSYIRISGGADQLNAGNNSDLRLSFQYITSA